MIPAAWWVTALLWLWELINCRGFVQFTCGAIMIYSVAYAGWRCWLEDDVD
ncbi:hypothetical protein [Saccharothrix sp. NRRL B-16348]|uniref:hypothetical protein n=1 Tax=Saccharothrix sp. NRRL B-16348 TaxID=1415542 RepID=UPI000B2730A2|nr:hypothetical protein [Saccharothrix sp. NRRL B-16348]